MTQRYEWTDDDGRGVMRRRPVQPREPMGRPPSMDIDAQMPCVYKPVLPSREDIVNQAMREVRDRIDSGPSLTVTESAEYMAERMRAFGWVAEVDGASVSYVYPDPVSVSVTLT